MLYKYLSTSSLSFESILSDNKVYFSPPSRMNDPFEFRPNIVLPSKSSLKKYLVMRGAKHKDLKYLVPKNMDLFRENINRVRDTLWSLSDRAGVLCLTPHFDNLLMWSHYGDCHKGICIGFDVLQPINENDQADPDFGLSVQVEYREAYPEISMLEIDHGLVTIRDDREKMRDLDSLTARILYVKSNVWSYENEVRFCNNKLDFTPGLVSFPKNKLKEIILGARIDSLFEQKVLEYVANYFPHAVVKKAYVSSTRYELEFERVCV